MKPINIIIAILVTVYLCGMGYGAFRVYQSMQQDDPLRAERVELEKTRILKDIETLKIQQERERQESAKLAAKLAKERAEQERQAKIQAAPVVVKSRMTLTAFLYLLPIGVTVVGVTGGAAYLLTRRTVVKTPFVETYVSRREAVAIARESLTVSNASEMAKAMAFTEELSQKRLAADVTVLKAMKGAAGKAQSVLEQPEQQAALPPMPVGAFRLADLLRDPDLEPDAIPLGRNRDTGQIVQSTPKHLTCVDIVGKQNHCKTTIMKMLTAGLLRLKANGKAIETYLIDPHAGLEDSLELAFRPYLGYFDKTVLGEKAIAQEEHIALLREIDAELIRRQEQGYSSPLLCILIDEMNDIFDQQETAKEFYRLLKKIRRLRKAGVFMVCVFHDSTKEGQGQVGTGLMNLNVSAFVVNATMSKAAKVLEDGHADMAVNLPRGQAVAKMPGGDPEVVVLPYVTDEDFAAVFPVATQQPETPPAPDNQSESVTLAQAVTAWLAADPERSQRKLAKETGISQTKISDYLRGKDRLTNEEKAMIYAHICPENDEKPQDVVSLESYRNARRIG